MSSFKNKTVERLKTEIAGFVSEIKSYQQVIDDPEAPEKRVKQARKLLRKASKDLSKATKVLGQKEKAATSAKTKAASSKNKK